MQSLSRIVYSQGKVISGGVLQRRSVVTRSLSETSTSPKLEDDGFESAKIADILKGNGDTQCVDRSTEGGVLGFGSRFLGQRSSLRFNSNRLIQSPFERLNALPLMNSSLSPATQLSQVRGFIQLKTNLEVADNSGAKRVQCIKVMKGSNAAKIGDIIMASVKDAQPRGKVKKGEVVTCVVVRAATQKLRRDGSEIKFDKNAVVLVNKQGEPIGTRIFGPVPHELRRRKLVKILTLAEYVA